MGDAPTASGSETERRSMAGLHPDTASPRDVVEHFFVALDRNDLSLLATAIHPAITFHAMTTEPPLTYTGWDGLLTYLGRRLPVGDRIALDREVTTPRGPYVLSVRWRSNRAGAPICLMVFAVHRDRIVEAWDLPIDVPLPLDEV
jgi:hypothetical protein